MTQYDTELKRLQGQIARARQLKVMIAELQQQREQLWARVRQLEEVKLDEQADVDRLEGRSLAAFFYNVIGKMDEKLDVERQEAYAARVKYDVAARELEAVEHDLARWETEQAELNGCEQRYARALEQKAAAVKSAGGAGAEELLKLEERLAFLQSQQVELSEAIAAGETARDTAAQVLDRLDSAEGWGTWDLLGGGLVADLAKHSDLDEAQEAIEMLQSQLRCFRTELTDVSIRADLQVNVDGFLRFADYFFDGLFADWAVMDQISRSQERVQETRDQIARCLTQLHTLQTAVEQERLSLKKRMDVLILETQLKL